MYDLNTSASGAVAPTLGNSAKPVRPLERISLAINRVNSATVMIGQFVDRFNGPSPAEPLQGAEIEAKAPYASDLERLFSALDRLETRVEALGQIG